MILNSLLNSAGRIFKKEIKFQVDPQFLAKNAKDLQNGRWTKAEHQLFVDAITTFGKNWQKIFDSLPTRSEQQVRSHAQKYFN